MKLFPQRNMSGVILHLVCARISLDNLESYPIILTICVIGNVLYAFRYLFGDVRIAAWWARHIVAPWPTDSSDI